MQKKLHEQVHIPIKQDSLLSKKKEAFKGGFYWVEHCILLMQFENILDFHIVLFVNEFLYCQKAREKSAQKFLQRNRLLLDGVPITWVEKDVYAERSSHSNCSILSNFIFDLYIFFILIV